jgi:hypothetical protein
MTGKNKNSSVFLNIEGYFTLLPTIQTRNSEPVKEGNDYIQIENGEIRDMGIKVAWGNEEKTIVFHIYEGHWTISDFYESVSTSRELLLQVDNPVDLIMDMSNCSQPPSGIFPAYKYADSQVPENQRFVVIIAAGVIEQAFDKIVDNIAPRASKGRVRVSNMEEAHEIIARFQETTG